MASELLRRVRLPENNAQTMPPATGHKRLTPEQIALLTRWIGEGAPYEQHWSYLPPRPQTPARAWSRSGPS